MNPNKKVVHLQGIVLLPVIVGCRVILLWVSLSIEWMRMVILKLRLMQKK